MKIVIAPDSYKESLSALEVATAIEQGFREIWPDADYLKLPLADGGEGTVEAMVEATAGRIVHVEVTGPLGHRVNAFYGLSGDARSAFIEMAAASGLEQVPPAQRDPLKTTSWGTGEGRIDSQTIHGKVPIGVANIAKRYNKPVIGIAGSLTADVSVVHEHGLDAVFSVIYTICTLEDALQNASENVRMTARNVAATLKAGQQLR